MTCIIDPDYQSAAWESIPGEVRQEVRTLLRIFREAPATGVTRWMHEQAATLRGAGCKMTYQNFRRLYYALRNSEGDWLVLVDKRKVPVMRAALERSRQPRFAAQLVTLVEQHKRKNVPAFRALKRQWAARQTAIPGYEEWPGWPQVPAGWTASNLAKIAGAATNQARLASIRIGTSSKTNPYLPTVLTTRVGLHPGAVIQLDDVWHDNLVTFGKKREVCRVIELGALDVFSACRFHWGAKPRRKRESGSWETIGGREMRMFLAGMFHRTGYSPRGTMLMSENQTAKVSEDIARALYDATGGMIRVDYQPIEGKQAALCGFWSGTEGGNFRAKACLESTHNLMHNDLASLPMQTGSPSSGLQGPVTTARIQSYIEKILRDVLAKVPHRADLLRLPTYDFHRQFIPFLTDYYEFGLNARTDHDLQGWQELGHVITEFTLMPGSDCYLGEREFLGLPRDTQAMLHSAVRNDPASWSRRRNLSPAEVWQRREKFLPIPPVVLCDMLGGDLAREVTARRGFLEFSDLEISDCPLIYESRFISGPRAGREIPHGEKVKMFALPFDDGTALVVDAKDRFLGEVPLYKRVLAIAPDAFGTDAPFEARPEIRSAALTRAAGEKHSRIADILEPSRILHAGEVEQARDLREHNKRVITGQPVTAEELHDARLASAAQGQRTAAANRLQARGSEVDYDAAMPAAPAAGLWDDLPEDGDVPEAF